MKCQKTVSRERAFPGVGVTATSKPTGHKWKKIPGSGVPIGENLLEW